MKKIFLIASVFTITDQIVKNILVFTLSFGKSIEIIPNFFSLTLLGNTGAAFSILSSSTIFLILLSLISLFLIYIFFLKGKEINEKDKWLYGILIGGILGNMIDRIARGEVIDYLDFTIFGYNFPVFNLADIGIVVTIIFLIIKIYEGDKNADKGK